MNDEQILQLIQSTETFEKGFRELMSMYQEKLYWHVRRMVESHEDANDVIQNTFIKVFKSIQKFQGKSKLYTWLYRIATNECLTFLSKRKKRTSTSLEDESLALGERLKADDYFDGNEAEIKLKQAIFLLPEKQKVVFNMRYYDDMSYREIAEVLETSEGALKASYHHAAKKIEAFILKSAS